MANKNSTDNSNNAQSTGCKQEPALYIIATPIGNMEDITFRAVRILQNVDIIACEDTRVTSKLLSHFSITTRTTCYNDHSSGKDREKIIAMIKAGKSVALVSDAGTPLISDPGYKLVRSILDEGLKVTSLPGASSVATALTLCGLPTDRFLFEGFLPQKSGSRQNVLSELKNIKATLVFFESARRLVSSLKDIATIFGQREIAVMREITKKFEEIKRGTAEELQQYYTDTPPRGEVVIVASPPMDNDLSQDDIDKQIKQALLNMSVKDAVSFVAENTDGNKKEIYQRALEIKKDLKS